KKIFAATSHGPLMNKIAKDRKRVTLCAGRAPCSCTHEHASGGTHDYERLEALAARIHLLFNCSCLRLCRRTRKICSATRGRCLHASPNHPSAAKHETDLRRQISQCLGPDSTRLLDDQEQHPRQPRRSAWSDLHETILR